LRSAPGIGAYCASKFALQCIAESLQGELEPYNIQVQTINPAAFKTGFNDAMAETATHWMDDEINFIKKSDIEKVFKPFLEHQRDPQDMIEKMIELIPGDTGKFRNVFPKEAEDAVKKETHYG